jgi:hypothetical protein
MQAGNNLVKPQCLIGGAGRGMGGVTGRADISDFGAAPFQIGQRELIE